MQERPFGSPKIKVPVIGQGTWKMETGDRTEAIRALQLGIDLGLRHIDTAELYGSGKVEELVGEAIRGRRKDVFLVSKVLPSNATFDGTIEACERSLSRLKTDYLDVYLLHWASEVPMDETIRAFEDLKSDGKIRAFGVSNFDRNELEEAVRLAGKGNIACNQVLYHLNERSIEHLVLPYCEKAGIAVVGYSPFAQGALGQQSPAWQLLSSIAEKYGATPRQVALCFLTRFSILFTIPKASTEEHVRENAGAAALKLTPGEIAQIDQAFPLGTRREGVPTL